MQCKIQLLFIYDETLPCKIKHSPLLRHKPSVCYQFRRWTDRNIFIKERQFCFLTDLGIFRITQRSYFSQISCSSYAVCTRKPQHQISSGLQLDCKRPFCTAVHIRNHWGLEAGQGVTKMGNKNIQIGGKDTSNLKT